MGQDDESTRQAALRALYPEVFTSEGVDFARLRQALGDAIDTRPERYGLDWDGRAEAVRAAQHPATGTLVPTPEDAVDFDDAPHCVIEGDNLEVLRILQRSYFGRVQLIFIDPPYNTGHTFLYADHYREGVDAYLRRTGQADARGRLSARPETGGRLHSRWLSMMYPRLLLARNLLSDTGFIALTIDDVEVHNLRILLDEIFGAENFIANAVWNKAYVANMTARHVSNTHDHVLIYAKRADRAEVGRLPRTDAQHAAFKNPDGDPRGPWKPENLSAGKPYSAGQFPITAPSGQVFHPPPGRYWRCNREKYEVWLADGRITFGQKGSGRPMLKKYLGEVRDGLTADTWWTHADCGTNKEASTELKKRFDGAAVFDTPKPVRLLRRILSLFGTADGIVLDFFAGAGVTAEAVLQANAEDGGARRFVLVQLPEAVDGPYPTIAAICRERIRRVLEQDELDAGFRAFSLARSGWQSWTAPSDRAALEAQLLAAVDRRVPDRSDAARLWELILRAGLPLHTAVETDRVAGQTVWIVEGSRLCVCLDTPIHPQTLARMRALAPERVVLLEGAFGGDEGRRANTLLNLRGDGIEVRVL